MKKSVLPSKFCMQLAFPLLVEGCREEPFHHHGNEMGSSSFAIFGNCLSDLPK